MNWGSDQLGWIRRLEFTAVAALAIATACVMIGQGAARYAEDAASSEIALSGADGAKAQSQRRGAPSFNAIDYATTGSIKGQTVVISPCLGQKNER